MLIALAKKFHEILRVFAAFVFRSSLIYNALELLASLLIVVAFDAFDGFLPFRGLPAIGINAFGSRLEVSD